MIHTMFFTKQSIQIVPRLVSHCDEVAYALILFHCVIILCEFHKHPISLSDTVQDRDACIGGWYTRLYYGHCGHFDYCDVMLS